MGNVLNGYFLYINTYHIDHKKNIINKIIYNKRRLKGIISRSIDDIIIDKQFLLDFIKYYYNNTNNIKLDNIEIDYNDNISGIEISSFNTNSKVRVSTSKNIKNETIYITINSESISLPKTINVNNECVYKGNIEYNKEIVEEVNGLLQTIIKKYMYLYIDSFFKDNNKCKYF